MPAAYRLSLAGLCESADAKLTRGSILPRDNRGQTTVFLRSTGNTVVCPLLFLLSLGLIVAGIVGLKLATPA